MSPGTISGSPNPDDRLRRDREAAAAPSPSQGDPISPSPSVAPFEMRRGVAFLVTTSIGCAAALVLLSHPVREGLAALLTALGHQTLGPSRYPGGLWGRVVHGSPQTYLAQIASVQLIFLACALAGAGLLGGGVRDRLGLTRPYGGMRVLGVALALETLTTVFGGALVAAFLPANYESPESTTSLLGLMHRVPAGWWFTLVAAMSFLPAICEETLFRGLVQRRLLLAWRPWAAILSTGVLFALLHQPLARGVALLPGSVWLGYLAWRTRSIVPGMLLHAFTNLAVQSFLRFGEPGAVAPREPGRLTFGLLALAAAALSAWLLVWLHRMTRPEAAERSPDDGGPTTMRAPVHPGGP